MPAPEGNDNARKRPGQTIKRGPPVGTQRTRKHSVVYRGGRYARISSAWAGAIEAHGLAVVLDAQRAALQQLVGAAQRALPHVVDDDASSSLDGRIEEAAECLRAFAPDEAAISI